VHHHSNKTGMGSDQREELIIWTINLAAKYRLAKTLARGLTDRPHVASALTLTKHSANEKSNVVFILFTL